MFVRYRDMMLWKWRRNLSVTKVTMHVQHCVSRHFTNSRVRNACTWQFVIYTLCS